MRSAGAALVAASVPLTLAAQSRDARPSGNNLKQMIIFGGVAEPNPLRPGIYGQACFQFQMQANIGDRGGCATISDPVFTEVNSQIQIDSGRADINDIYVFRGTVRSSNSSELIGKPVTVKIELMETDNCNVSLTIENTPVQGLLLPAIQKIRVPIYS